MTLSPHGDFAHGAETALPGLDLAALRKALLAQAREHGLEVLRDDGASLAIATAYGRCRLIVEAGAARAEVDSPRADWLFALKEALSEHASAIDPAAAQRLRWSDAAPEGGRPPNFQLAEILSAAPLCRDFLRVTARAEDLSAYGDDAIHFRLVLPPPGDPAPEWPRIGPGGATIWPKGAKALHRPVYTARRVDAARGELTFDLFVHEGGRASAWARSVAAGARVGLAGPGGGGVPRTRRIALYADETGYPAVARILEALPPDATGHAVLSAAGAAPSSYPLPTHPGVRLRWLAQGSATRLARIAIAERSDDPARSLWFAAEKAGAQMLRDWCRANGVDLRDHHVAAYWTRDESKRGNRT
ncbi:siderophore-interacting protein [Oceanicella actignis]|uniref:NADPH-dependent ferric siderophore reductase, contains FAD-binding and SIP domains n=1 Tax=Oceanicella actignis TaxID=1189325 RepID=A0A1M7SFA1_9RHOB|nr:siderophore-interacting protein [Oceanicella actignis]SET22658.1 NADPH-dependent ferric siderophore reductase, contains FAD-binding and SIP domains [Oceanicella actignis]SHN57153.1 NADPH-dependent ferric siderophore reductase, contains FAD-binding and SIP domains [Oceanicella actignis]